MFDSGGVWCLLCQGGRRVGDRDMLVVLDVYLLLSSGSSLGRITWGEAKLSLRYRPSPGFHQKVGIGSLLGRVSFLVRVSV